MKNFLLFLTLILFSFSAKPSNDIIYKIDRTEIECKIIEIDEANRVVKYKLLSNLDGPLFSISNSDIFMVTMNGSTWKPKAESGFSGNVSAGNDGNTQYTTIGGYKAVVIGTQTWMVENLDVDHFRNGDPIPELQTAAVEWPKSPACCYYGFSPEYGKLYGKLYNYYAVNDSRGLAPVGWHIPTSAEWNILFDYLGGKQQAGKALKATNSWTVPNTNTNSSGFSALPGGNSGTDTRGYNAGSHAYFWSYGNINKPGDYSIMFADIWYLYYGSDGIGHQQYGKMGFSVRCIKD